MTPHIIHSEQELTFSRGAHLALGVCLGAVVASVALPVVDRLFPAADPAVAPVAPQIIEQGPMRTVIRVPTKKGGAELACTITIDHARRSYAVAC